MSVTGFTAGELAYLRAHPQSTPVYLAVHKPRTAYSGTVTAAPTWPTDGTGAATIAISGGTPGAATIAAGQTCRVGSDSRDWLRLRTNATSPLAVAATSQSALPITPGTALTVLEDYRPAPKRLRYSGGAWYVDFDVSYSDQATAIPPVAIAGPAAIIYCEGTAVEFAFTGARSYSLVSSIASHSWALPDGSTVSDETFTWGDGVAYPDGRWVEYTVTDAAGKSQLTRRLLWKFDAAHPPYTAFVLGGIEAEWAGGARATVRVIGSAATTDIPDGAHVALFTGQTFSGSAANVGGNFPARANVLLEGWIVEGSIKRDPWFGWVEFQIATLDSLLDKLVAFSVSLTTSGSVAASDWTQMQNLSIDKAMLHVCRYASNILEIADVYTPGEQTPDIAASVAHKEYQDLSGNQSLWAQMRENYEWLLGGAVSVDSQGAVWCEQDAQIAQTNASLPAMFALSAQDRIGQLNLSTNYLKEQAQVVLYAINYDTPIGSASPDYPPDYGGEVTARETRLHATQAQLNVWSGGQRYKRNNPYPSVSLQTAGAYRIDPAPQSVITWTPQTGDTPRNPAWSGKRLIVRKASWQFNSALGSLMCDYELEPAVTSVDGVTLVLDQPIATPITTPPEFGVPGTPSEAYLWTFDTDEEGWIYNPGVNTYGQWDGSTGQPFPGCLYLQCTGLANQAAYEFWFTSAQNVQVKTVDRFQVWVKSDGPYQVGYTFWGVESHIDFYAADENWQLRILPFATSGAVRLLYVKAESDLGTTTLRLDTAELIIT